VRDFGVKLKLNPVRNLLEGKRVILIDDSIIRGTTSRKSFAWFAARAPKKCTCASVPADDVSLLLRSGYTEQARPHRSQQVRGRDSPVH